MAFVGLDRDIVNHWIYQDAEYFKVWFEMLHKARFSKEPHIELVEGELVAINYGEFIYGRIKWSERLKVSEQRLRTLIKKLKADEMIESVLEHRKFTLYRIKNYAKYNQQGNQQQAHIQQGFTEGANQQSNHQLTISQPSANHQPTTKEQRKKVNKENNNIDTFSAYTTNTDLQEALMSFVEFRKDKKKPMNEKAITLLLGKLNKLAKSDNEKKEILEQSILNGWQGIFELKGNAIQTKQDKNAAQMDVLQQIYEEGENEQRQGIHSLPDRRE